MNLKDMTVGAIRALCVNEDEIDENLFEALARDERSGVRQVYDRMQKRRMAYQRELARIKTMNQYEDVLRQKGYTHIAGIDEVGRGPLAGPVVAAAVVLPQDAIILGINDSKKIPEPKRERLAEEIKAKAVAWSVKVVDEDYIEKYNILQASLYAMRLAVEELGDNVDHLLVDAVTVPGVAVPQQGIIGGDALSASIAAASIVAKVTRDALMKELHQIYPQYGFDQNKGYASAAHCDALREYGPTPVHRKLFIRNILA